MPRYPRPEEEGAVHHVFARGNRAAAVFVDDEDRQRYMRFLGRVVKWERWKCLSYCLMTNHLHLLVETPEPNLGAGMQRLQGDYARTFNKRHGTIGHVFQGRYGSVRVKDDAQLIAVVRYIDRNPVEAQLVTRTEDWPWSSAAALRGASAPSWLALDRLRELLPGGRIELDDEPKGSDPLGCYPSERRASASRETPSSISSAVTPE